MAGQTEKIKVDSDAGKRLDLYLALRFPEHSRSFLKKLITSDKVKVNGEIEFHPQYRVKLDDSLEVEIPTDAKPDEKQILPVKGELDIVFESEKVLAISKPVGVVVHPAAGHYTDTLANWVKYYLQGKDEDLWGTERAGLVHRLDKPTSGLILFAKSPEALWYLSRQFAERKVDKSYLAVVSGHLKQSFIIDEAIGRDPYNRKKISSRGRKKRSARTHFTPIAHSKDGSYTLLSAKPITGRTHQIRVHLKEHGHPIVGDMTYKGEKHSRLMLHAHKLSISIAPQTEATTLEAAPTGDFLSGLEQLGFDLAAVRIL